MSKIKIGGFALALTTGPFGVPEIRLFKETTYTGQQKDAAILFFKPDNSTLPNPDLTNGIIHLFYHQKDFFSILDLGRNVKPLFAAFGENPGTISGLIADPIIPV